MAEAQTNGSPEASETAAPAPGRSNNEVALELMKFIATATGYGKAAQGSAGFSGKPQTRSPEEHTDALLELFDRCRGAVNKD
jgi:hypothetical protein